MKLALAKTILLATLIWAVTWGLFWLCALVWLHASHAQVYDYFAQGVPGTIKTIDNRLLAAFEADKRMAITICAFGSLIISQSSLFFTSLKK